MRNVDEGAEDVRAEALGALAEHLDGAQLSEALDAARQIGNERARRRAGRACRARVYLTSEQKRGVRLVEALPVGRQRVATRRQMAGWLVGMDVVATVEIDVGVNRRRRS